MSTKFIYTEKGCQFHEDCLTCPFPDCGDIGDYRMQRDREIVELYSKGKDTKVIAGIFNISVRTVQRALKNRN